MTVNIEYIGTVNVYNKADDTITRIDVIDDIYLASVVKLYTVCPILSIYILYILLMLLLFEYCIYIYIYE